jgi:hypothetical protein
MSAMSRKVVTAALALAVLAVPTSARADVVRGPEPMGDQVAWQLDPVDPVCGAPAAVDAPEGSDAFDLTGISVRHKRYQVALTARFAAPRAQRSVEFELQTPRGRWMVLFERSHGERYLSLSPEPTWQLEDWDIDGDGDVDCQGWTGTSSWVPCDVRAHASLSADHRALGVLIPRRCLGNPHWVQAGATSRGWRGGTVLIDSWDPSGPDGRDLDWDPNHHVYGPRVLAGPNADDTAAPPPHGRAVSRTTIVSMNGLVTR